MVEQEKPKERHLWQHPESKIWYVRKQINGERQCISTGETSISKARQRRDTIIGRLKDARWEVQKATPTVEEWWLRFQAGELGFRAPGTQRVYRHAMERLQPKFSATQLHKITKMSCKEQILWLKKSKYSASTIKTAAACYQRVFEAAKEDRLITENPWKGIELEKPKIRTRVLSPDEERALVSTLSPYNQRWFFVLLLSGLRISELRWLHPACFDWEAELMTVFGKGKKREVPIDVDLVPLLRAQIMERGIADQPNARLWTEVSETFEGLLRRRSKQLGIPAVTPHTLRHTFATRFVEASGNVFILSKILGHSTVTMTERQYLHESPESLVREWKRVMRGYVTATEAKTA